MRRYLIIVLLAIVGLFLGVNGFTQEEKGPGAGDMTSKMMEGRRVNAFMVEKIIGSKVVNMKEETLGKIGDLIVDIDTGRIVYAVLDSGGFLGIGDKLLPVPWESLAALPSEGIFFLNQSKEQMKNAPAFNRNNFPNMTDMGWGEGISRHYGVFGYNKRTPMGYYGYYDDPMYSGPRKDEDPYGKIFDAKTIKTLSGQVIKVDQVPDPGFGLEMRLTVLIDKKEILPVYLGPAFYIVGTERANPFKIGDKVTVTGSQVIVRGEPFILATTVRRGNDILRLRDKDGTPEWVGWKKASD